MLVHLGEDVEAAVTERVDLLCKKFDTLARVAEDNRLGNL